MLEKERKALFERDKDYISIGISEGGVHYGIIPVMWEGTASAFNMRTPDIFIAPEDLLDGEIMERLESFTVYGLYIYAPLDDYGFISCFKSLQDLHIEGARKLNSLDFLAELVDLSMLFIEGASLDNVDLIWDIKTSGKGFMPYRNIGLYDCDVARAPSSEYPPCRFTEFLVWSRAENAQRDRELWADVVALTKRYYLVDPDDRNL